MYAPVPKKTRAEVRWQNKMFRSTECVRDLDKELRLILSNHFQPLFKQASFFEAAHAVKKLS